MRVGSRAVTAAAFAAAGAGAACSGSQARDAEGGCTKDVVPAVHGISDRLQQAILNLVLNAIQAMPHGGSVALKTSSASGMVRVTVQDTGPGLPEGIAEHQFDSKVTTKPGGSGLGLPLVRLIAEAHGGTVWYRSDPGKGAAFTLVLPSARQAVA